MKRVSPATSPRAATCPSPPPSPNGDVSYDRRARICNVISLWLKYFFKCDFRNREAYQLLNSLFKSLDPRVYCDSQLKAIIKEKHSERKNQKVAAVPSHLIFEKVEKLDEKQSIIPSFLELDLHELAAHLTLWEYLLQLRLSPR